MADHLGAGIVRFRRGGTLSGGGHVAKPGFQHSATHVFGLSRVRIRIQAGVLGGLNCFRGWVMNGSSVFYVGTKYFSFEF